MKCEWTDANLLVEADRTVAEGRLRFVGVFAGSEKDVNVFMCPVDVVSGISPSSAEAPRPDASDMVNHPPHYQSHTGIEAIHALRAMLGDAAFVAHCRATAAKYIWRADKKGAAVEDMRKAVWYLQAAIGVQGEIDKNGVPK